MVISHFCYDIKTRRAADDIKTRSAAAPPVLDPLFLNFYSVINGNDISFKFCV